MTPRRAALVGIVFLVFAGAYAAFGTAEAAAIEPAAIVMLVALAIAMSFMAIVLFTGLKNG